MADPIEAWMTKVAAGDKIAFRDLVHHMGGRLFALAYRLLNDNAHMAEDAVQDALIKLWVSAPNWRPSGKASAYITTILYNACMDLHRKNQTQFAALPDNLSDPAENADELLVRNDHHRLLMQTIDALPERQRTVILLSYFGGEPNRRIAEILNVTEGAVESLLVRARQNLARDLPESLRPHFEQEKSNEVSHAER